MRSPHDPLFDEASFVEESQQFHDLIIFRIDWKISMKKPKHHYCHRNVESLNNFTGLGRGMEVIEKVGEGSFGQVYKVYDHENSRLLIVKKSKEGEDQTMREQAQVLQELSNSQGFRKITQNSKQMGKNLMMNCLGSSLGAIIKKKKKINVFSMKKIAVQLLQKLEELHFHRYVHRDLKPDNILLGDRMDCHSVYLIDFGLVTTYRSKPAKRRKVYNGLVGTAKFSSIASHQGHQQFPIDDLQSLGYILLYLVQGSIPWDQFKIEEEGQLFDQIYEMKKKASMEQLCGGFNCLRAYMSKIKSLDLTNKINYKGLMKIFEIGEDMHQYCFDFCEDCWVQKSLKKEKSKKIEQQPRAGQIRLSIFD